MKIMYIEKHKNAVSPGKSVFHIAKIERYHVFHFKKKGADCETLFSVFFFSKNLSKKKKPVQF